MKQYEASEIHKALNTGQDGEMPDSFTFVSLEDHQAALAQAQDKLDAQEKELAKCGALELDIERLVAKLAAMEKELHDAKTQCGNNAISHMTQYYRADDLRQQLATAQNEIDTATDQIPPDMEGDSLSVALIKLCDERKTLREQLAAMEQYIYDELQELIPYVGLPSESPAHFRITEAARIIRLREQQLQTAREQQERLREVILWLLGEKGEFPDRPEKVEGKIQPLYWWRTELRKRFEALQATPSGDAFDARAAVVELAEMVEASDRLRRLPLAGDVQRAVELKRKAQG